MKVNNYLAQSSMNNAALNYSGSYSRYGVHSALPCSSSLSSNHARRLENASNLNSSIKVISM
jgi:hypothetical protein